jgi:ribosomal protein S18 acetylase RimI-like enzyme
MEHTTGGKRQAAGSARNQAGAKSAARGTRAEARPTPETPHLVLRAVLPSDLPRLKEIVALSWKDQGIAHILEKRYGEMGGKPWLDWKWPQVEKVCRDTPRQVLVTEVNGEVAGFAVYLLDRVRKIGTVGNNAVHPKFRGFGIGKRQIARVIELLRERGMAFAEVTVALNEGHAAARAVYEKTGFEPVADSRYMFMRLD